jgi:hypothetical protein
MKIHGLIQLLLALAALLSSLPAISQVAPRPPGEGREGGEKTDRPPYLRMVRIEAGWEMMVNPDGSGSVQFGSSAGDGASFPKGTLVFKDLLEAVKSKGIVPVSDPESIQVDIQTSVVAESRALRTEWNAACEKILPHLKSLEPERLAFLLGKHPLGKVPPPKGQTDQAPEPARIALSIRETGWRLTVLPDGSGTAAYGSSFQDVFSFPKGTVSFGKLLTTAKAKALVPPKDALSVEVSISMEGEATLPKKDSRAMATDWNELWATITPHLKSNRPERLAHLLEKESPARKIPPRKEDGEMKELPVEALELAKSVSGWSISVAPDGSGIIAYGSLAGDFATFPKGTVDFEKLVATAKAKKTVDGAEASRVHVVIRTSERQAKTVAEPKAMLPEWEELCARIKKNLHARNPERIENLLEIEPLGEEKTGGPVKVRLLDPRAEPRPPRPMQKAE